MKGNVSFAVLAGNAEAALQDYRDAEQRVADAQEELAKAREALGTSEEWLRDKAKELFEVYPELQRVLGPGLAVAAPSTDWQPPGGGGPEPIVIDDPDELPVHPSFREAPGQRTHEEQ